MRISCASGGWALWERDDPRRQRLIDRRCATVDDVARWVGEERDAGPGGPGGPAPRVPELVANAALVLLAVACALLDRQLAAQAKAFENEGGFTERLYRVRTEKRKPKP